jgi:hypothetical protein
MKIFQWKTPTGIDGIPRPLIIDAARGLQGKLIREFLKEHILKRNPLVIYLTRLYYVIPFVVQLSYRMSGIYIIGAESFRSHLMLNEGHVTTCDWCQLHLVLIPTVFFSLFFHCIRHYIRHCIRHCIRNYCLHCYDSSIRRSA